MNGYLKQALVTMAVMFIVYRVSAVRSIVIGA